MANQSPIDCIELVFSYNDPDDPQSKVDYAYLDSIRARGLFNILRWLSKDLDTRRREIESGLSNVEKVPNGLRIQARAILAEIEARSR